MLFSKFKSFFQNDTVFKVTVTGFIVNSGLTIGKYIAGFLGNSSAMIADATHSLSDLASDLIILIVVRFATKPADENHRYGHGKFETFAIFIVGSILFLVASGILFDAIRNIVLYFQGTKPIKPEKVTLIAAIISIIIKELMFWFTYLYAKKLNSQLLLANAWHHRSDSLSSIAALAGIAGAIYLGEKWSILDPLAAIVVCVMIYRVALKIIIPAIHELLEKSLPEDIRQEICSIIRSVEHVQKPHNLKTRKIGDNYAIEVHIYLDKNMSVMTSHQITEEIERRLKVRFGPLTHVIIHVEPI